MDFHLTQSLKLGNSFLKGYSTFIQWLNNFNHDAQGS